MQVIVDWGNQEETLIVWKFPFQWGYSDYEQALRRAFELSASKPHLVDVMCDLRPSRPPTINPLSLVQTGLASQPKNVGVILLVINSAFWLRMFELLCAMHPQIEQTIIVVKTVDQAYAALEHVQQNRTSTA